MHYLLQQVRVQPNLGGGEGGGGGGTVTPVMISNEYSMHVRYAHRQVEEVLGRVRLAKHSAQRAENRLAISVLRQSFEALGTRFSSALLALLSFKRTNADADGAAARALPSASPSAAPCYSIYSLYSHKPTNTDAEGAGAALPSASPSAVSCSTSKAWHKHAEKVHSAGFTCFTLLVLHFTCFTLLVL
jgi:hypothetical protein